MRYLGQHEFLEVRAMDPAFAEEEARQQWLQRFVGGDDYLDRARKATVDQAVRLHART